MRANPTGSGEIQKDRDNMKTGAVGVYIPLKTGYSLGFVYELFTVRVDRWWVRFLTAITIRA